MNNSNADHLVDMYSDTILRISYMYLKQTYCAEDICQEVFLKLISKDLEFKSQQHEKSWIIRTTINACKDHLRTDFWKRVVELDDALELEASDKTESGLLDLVMLLPKNYRVSIYLYYYEGYQVNEIAILMGKTANTVSSYLYRGKNKLRKMMENDIKLQELFE